MAYELKRSESVSHGLKRVAKKELRSALDRLQHSRAQRDEAVHKGRKCIKKVRAVLELIRQGIGSDYRKGKGRLRRAAQPLSAERDAIMLMETFAALRRRHRTQLGPSTWTAVRRALEAAAKRAAGRARRPAAIGRTLEALDDVHDRARSWSLDAKGFRALRPGLKRSFARAREALLHAQQHPDPTSLHDWRKRVKTQWYHLRLLEPMSPKEMRPFVTRLDKLESGLGTHHDLVVLRSYLHAARLPRSMQDDVARLDEIITRTQARLRDDALALGDRIYSEDRRTFLRRLERLWHAWKHRTRTRTHTTDRTRRLAA